MIRPLLGLALLGTMASGLFAQAVKPKNPLEDRFKPFRLEIPAKIDSAKFLAMQKGNVALEPVAAGDQAILDDMARSLIYPITFHELYGSAESTTAELTPRRDEYTMPKLISGLRDKMVFYPPGDKKLAPTQIQFCREFGASAVRAIEEVLGKGPPAIIRMNAMWLLSVVAESGAPAPWAKITASLKKKDDKDHPVEVLYYGLKAAEMALASYDPIRGAKWVDKNAYFDLVTLVESCVQKVPDCVAEKTFVPEKPISVLTSDPKAKPTGLLPEQIETMQVFRLQAIKALSKVRVDIVVNLQTQERRTLHTLARVASQDPSLVPAVSSREAGEAVIGLVNAMPSEAVNGDVLAAAVAKGVSAFLLPKVGDTTTEVQYEHWRLAGTRMKAAFANWEAMLATPQAKLSRPEKDTLIELSKRCVSKVFDPLSKQNELGTVQGLDKASIDEWLSQKIQSFKGEAELFRDRPKYALPFGPARK